MELFQPSYRKDPNYITGENEIDFFDFRCEECNSNLKIDMKKQIENSWNGKIDINDSELEKLRSHYQIGLMNKSHEGGFPVFGKIVCNCGSSYFSYCGVMEFRNSAFAVQVQGIMNTEFLR